MDVQQGEASNAISNLLDRATGHPSPGSLVRTSVQRENCFEQNRIAPPERRSSELVENLTYPWDVCNLDKPYLGREHGQGYRSKKIQRRILVDV